MPRGDLRSPAAASQRFERLLERKRDLVAVPPARQTGSHCLAPVHFHAKAGEAQRTRPFYRRVVMIVRAETVAGFTLATPGAQHRVATLLLVGGPARGRHPPLTQRELLTGCLVWFC